MKDYVDWAELGGTSPRPTIARWKDPNDMSDDQPERKVFRRKSAKRNGVDLPPVQPKPSPPVAEIVTAEPTVQEPVLPPVEPEVQAEDILSEDQGLDDLPDKVLDEAPQDEAPQDDTPQDDLRLDDDARESGQFTDDETPESLEFAPEDQLPAPLPEDWERLRNIRPGVRKHILGNLPLINFFREDPAARAFDLLRSRLLQGLNSQGWKRVAVAAPTSGCGATFTAVNLALSLARIPDRRIVLMDLNQRDPGVAAALDIRGHGDMRAYLRGDIDAVHHLVRVGDTLAVGLSDTADRFAAELLHGPGAAEVLDTLVETLEPDVVIYDLPAVLSHDDFVACLPHVDGVLLVADATKTTAAHIAACEEVMGDQAGLLGVVLNRARASTAEV